GRVSRGAARPAFSGASHPDTKRREALGRFAIGLEHRGPAAGRTEPPAAGAASKGRDGFADRRRGRTLDRRDHVGRLRGDRPAPARDSAVAAGPDVLPGDVAGLGLSAAAYASWRPSRAPPQSPRPGTLSP